MANGLPYYPLYVYDFDESDHVLAMNLTEVGLYQLALNEAWKRGSIPADPKELAIKIRRKPAEVCKAWPKVRPCWIENGTPGRLINPRQEIERELAMGRSSMASVAGLASATARKETKRIQRTLVPRGFDSGSVSESGLEVSNNQENSTRARGNFVDFEMFLARWSHHLGFKKPNKHLRELVERKFVKVQMDESEMTASMDGYYQNEWAKSQHYPILGYLKDPLSWIPADAPVPAEAEAPESHPEAPLRVELALVRNYLAEWNAAVPQALATWHAKYSPLAALRECSEDPEFQSSFGGLCVIAERIHAARGAEVGWLTFEWLLKAKAGESPGWLKLRGMGWMAKESSDDRMVREIEEEQRRSA